MDIVLIMLFGICCAIVGAVAHHEWIHRNDREVW